MTASIGTELAVHRRLLVAAHMVVVALVGLVVASDASRVLGLGEQLLAADPTLDGEQLRTLLGPELRQASPARWLESGMGAVAAVPLLAVVVALPAAIIGAADHRWGTAATRAAHLGRGRWWGTRAAVAVGSGVTLLAAATATGAVAHAVRARLLVERLGVDAVGDGGGTTVAAAAVAVLLVVSHSSVGFALGAASRSVLVGAAATVTVLLGQLVAAATLAGGPTSAPALPAIAQADLARAAFRFEPGAGLLGPPDLSAGLEPAGAVVVCAGFVFAVAALLGIVAKREELP